MYETKRHFFNVWDVSSKLYRREDVFEGPREVLVKGIYYIVHHLR